MQHCHCHTNPHLGHRHVLRQQNAVEGPAGAWGRRAGPVGSHTAAGQQRPLQATQLRGQAAAACGRDAPPRMPRMASPAARASTGQCRKLRCGWAQGTTHAAKHMHSQTPPARQLPTCRQHRSRRQAAAPAGRGAAARRPRGTAPSGAAGQAGWQTRAQWALCVPSGTAQPASKRWQARGLLLGGGSAPIRPLLPPCLCHHTCAAMPPAAAASPCPSLLLGSSPPV